MEQKMPTPTNKIDVKAMKTIYEVRAPYANMFYLTNVQGIFRLAFCEVVPELKDEMEPVCAVTLTLGDLMGLSQMLSGTCDQAMKQISKQQEKSPAEPDVADKKQDTLEDLIANILPKKTKEQVE